MKKSTLSMMLLATALFSAHSNSATKRLIVSVESPNLASGYSVLKSQMAAPVQETCLSLRSGNTWCVPVMDRSVNTSLRSQSTSGSIDVRSTSLKSLVVDVPDELSLLDALRMLQQTGLYQYVERDVAVKSFSGWHSGTPNDPEFNRQRHFFDFTTGNQVGTSVMSMWRRIANPTKNVDVYVMDGGFRLHDDINYAAGFNFTTVSFDHERRAGFLEHEFREDCTSNHGLGVAGVIAANIGNEKSVAGVVGDVTVHPLRVLNCRNGFLSDVAAAMDWLTGDKSGFNARSPDLPKFNGKPGVINLSLGGEVPEQTCPHYLQSQIDKAVAAGFVVVAAAGNENIDVAKVSPANCRGVIAVGASHQPSGGDIDLAGFSNYGKRLDTVAWGSSMPGLSVNSSGEQAVTFWSGTSFASPLVAGLIAAISKDYTFNSSQWRTLVSISGRNNFTSGGRCETLGCNGGFIDALMLQSNAEKMQEGELNRMEYSLSVLSPCRQAWAVNNLLPGKKLCDQVTVILDAFGQLEDRDVIKLFSTEIGGEANSKDTTNMYEIGQYGAVEFSTDKKHFIGKDVYGQKCDIDTGLCGELSKMSIKGILEVPAACQ